MKYLVTFFPKTIELSNNTFVKVTTVIPRLARFLWQPENRVRWNSCYASLYYDYKNSKKYLHSTIFYRYKIVLWKYFYAGSQIRAVQIRAMRNRASKGMPVSSLGCTTNSIAIFQVLIMNLYRTIRGRSCLFLHSTWTHVRICRWNFKVGKTQGTKFNIICFSIQIHSVIMHIRIYGRKICNLTHSLSDFW